MTTFRRLLAAHVATDPAETTLVLAAVAAFQGLKADGSPMLGGEPAAPTFQQIADELGVHVGAVRRGVRHLEAAGVVTVGRGVHVSAEALRARWAARSATIGLPRDLRQLALRCEALLVAGLVEDNRDQRGRLVMGLARLGARTGLSRRCVQRALANGQAAGAIHRWQMPGRGPLCIAMGQRRETSPEKPRGTAPVNAPPGVPPRETVEEPRETVARASRNGRSRIAKRRPQIRNPGVPEPPDARARAMADREPEKQPAAEADKAPADLTAAILRTDLWEDLPPFARLANAQRLRPALERAGMTTEQFVRLWELAGQVPNVRSRTGLFVHWLRGDWRGVLDEPEAKAQHRAALARGAAARSRDARDELAANYRDTTKPVADLVDDVVARIKQA